MRTPGFVDTIPSQPGSDAAIEEIVGPICGYHLACYTVEQPEGFFAYAKLCLDRPKSVWKARAVRKMGAGPYASPEAAITGVVDLATARLSRRREEQYGLQFPWGPTIPGA